MSKELDRKIAELVMGEKEPAVPLDFYDEDADLSEELWPSLSTQGNWWCNPEIGWTPLEFSNRLEYAMRAVDEYLSIGHFVNLPLLQTYYDPTAQEWAWTALLVSWDEEARDWIPNEVITLGHTLPEAICNLLVALVESNSG